MSLPAAFASAVFCLALAGILSVFVLNPALAWVMRRSRGQPPAPPAAPEPSASVIVVVHNGGSLIGEKLKNTLELDYPGDRLEVIVYSDGSTDDTAERVAAVVDDRVRLLVGPRHAGKYEGLNAAVRESSGAVLVFSDADALLAPDALRHLVAPFADPAVGGVCGRRVISDDARPLEGAQRDYIAFDTRIKLLESASGSLTSNDGKLYAIRRELFREIPPAVTDDLYVALCVIEQRRRFLFEPRARARIRIPSRSLHHEIERRRRIVSTSLRGIWAMRATLNPLHHGLFSIRLFVNKVLRRLLPVFLLALFSSSLALTLIDWRFGVLLLPQVGFYLIALFTLVGLAPAAGKRRSGRICAATAYFCVGNYGSLLGVVDFLRGRRIKIWEPLKSDG